jgi:hypothetical protein
VSETGLLVCKQQSETNLQRKDSSCQNMAVMFIKSRQWLSPCSSADCGSQQAATTVLAGFKQHSPSTSGTCNRALMAAMVSAWSLPCSSNRHHDQLSASQLPPKI